LHDRRILEMQHLTKKRVLFSFVVASLVFYVLLFSITTDTIPNVSAVGTNGVGVYWDRNCNYRVFSIDWETLEPSSVKGVVVYIQNEVEEPIYLVKSTKNWNPSKASQYMTLGWDYTGKRINLGETLKITLTLSVSRYIQGISTFSFDIIITGSPTLPCDVNGNGVIDGLDYSLFGAACNAHGPDIPDPGDPPSENWDPNCDFNDNGMIEALDYATFVAYWRENI
jgi:hypothetical protein